MKTGHMSENWAYVSVVDVLEDGLKDGSRKKRAVVVGKRTRTPNQRRTLKQPGKEDDMNHAVVYAATAMSKRFEARYS